jgi:pyrroline-5-carboxylate reductase
MRTTFIGGGVMAEAILGRAVAGQVLAATDICVAEPIADRRAYLSDTYGVAVSGDNAAAVDGAGLVVLSVKPQHFAAAAEPLKGKLGGEQTVFSIIAGLTIGTISQGLAHDAVIRVMPNTPAQIGEGMSVWTATAAVNAEAQAAAKVLLGVMGVEWQVADEHYLDMATALSGSGPAYVFAFIESLVEAGVYMGMPRDMATTLAVQTVVGSAKLASETGDNPALLRERVTSPGGTTAEALRELELRGFRATILEAVAAAYRRARELGGNA